MKIIELKEKDTFANICDLINDNEKEKYLLMGSLLQLYKPLIGKKNIDELMKVYIDRYASHIKESYEIIDKEQEILKKMQHYLQLLISNNKYHYFTDSYYYDYFKEIVSFLKVNKSNRYTRTITTLVAIRTGLQARTLNVNIAGDPKHFENLLTDEAYQNIIKKIPKK